MDAVAATPLLADHSTNYRAHPLGISQSLVIMPYPGLVVTSAIVSSMYE